MITLNKLFQLIVEGSEQETTGHMTHIGDWAIYGNPEHALEHAESMHRFLNGEGTEDHSVSLKADGGESVVFGKRHDGRTFISYKSGKKLFHSPEEIKEAGVPWAENGIKIFKYISEMPIEHGTAFQGDVLWTDPSHKQEGHIRPNTVRYVPTEHDMGIAIHSQYTIDPEGKLKRTSNVPDLQQVKHEKVYAPDLQIKLGQIKLTPERNAKVAEALSNARSELTPEVKSYATSVSPDSNPEMHDFLQQYLNEVVATTGKRSVESLRSYLHQPIYGSRTSYGFMEKATQRKKSDKARAGVVERIERHINENEGNLEGLFRHMQHISTAKHIMDDQFHEDRDKLPALKLFGKSERHEGVVHAIGKFLAKLTKEGINGFSARNRRRGVERGFTKKRETPHPNVPFVDHTENIFEEGEGGGGGMMTASSGDIAGMGYNLGKEGPDDLVIRRQKTRPMRRKIAQQLLGRMNVGREAY